MVLLETLQAIPGLTLRANAPLADLTRFGIGGPADLLAETDDPQAFLAALRACRAARLPFYIIGDGSNLIVSDQEEGKAARRAGELADALRTAFAPDEGAVLGPAAAPLARLRGRHRWHVILKYTGDGAPDLLRRALAACGPWEPGALTVDVDPVSLM